MYTQWSYGTRQRDVTCVCVAVSSCDQRRFFWVRWENGTIQVGADTLFENAFLSWTDTTGYLIEAVMVESAADVSAVFDFPQEEGEPVADMQ